MNQTRHRKLSIFIPELGAGRVFAVLSLHLTTFPQDSFRHTMGNCFPEGPYPLQREARKDGLGSWESVCLCEASNQVKTGKAAHYLLSFK